MQASPLHPRRYYESKTTYTDYLGFRYSDRRMVFAFAVPGTLYGVTARRVAISSFKKKKKTPRTGTKKTWSTM